MKFQVNDRVAYSVQWLRSTGQSHSDLAHARGKIIELKELSKECILAKIEWDGPADEFPARVNVANLAKVGPNRRFANCD